MLFWAYLHNYVKMCCIKVKRDWWTHRFGNNCMADLVQNELLALWWACLYACSSPHRLSVLMLKAAESGPWETYYPQSDINRTIYPVFHLLLHLQSQAVCACISLFPFLLSYISFLFLNNSCFKILRVDSGERENINLRPTPSVKVISHLSPTLASCHVTKTASLSRSLSPNCLHYHGHLACPQPHCSNGANAIKKDSCWCNLFWKSDERMWTDDMLQ